MILHLLAFGISMERSALNTVRFPWACEHSPELKLSYLDKGDQTIKSAASVGGPTPHYKLCLQPHKCQVTMFGGKDDTLFLTPIIGVRILPASGGTQFFVRGCCHQLGVQSSRRYLLCSNGSNKESKITSLLRWRSWSSCWCSFLIWMTHLMAWEFTEAGMALKYQIWILWCHQWHDEVEKANITSDLTSRQAVGWGKERWTEVKK